MRKNEHSRLFERLFSTNTIIKTFIDLINIFTTLENIEQ